MSDGSARLPSSRGGHSFLKQAFSFCSPIFWCPWVIDEAVNPLNLLSDLSSWRSPPGLDADCRQVKPQERGTPN